MGPRARSAASPRHLQPAERSGPQTGTGTDADAAAKRQSEEQHEEGGPHWQSWLLRGSLLAGVVYQVAVQNPEGARVAGIGLALSLVPPLITRFSHWHIPRLLDSAFALAMALQFLSESFKLFEVFTYWDKLVHPAEIFLASGIASFLLLGYLELKGYRQPDTMVATGAILFGISLGAFWELVEFALDWFGAANLQKSNADTLTDILTNNAGAVFGTLLFFWLYRHHTSPYARKEFGRIADWLTERIARTLDRHGAVVGVAFGLAMAAIIAAGWLVDRGPIPAPPAAQGQPQTWHFTADTSWPRTTAPLLGAWVPQPQGICRQHLEPGRPGSERMGLFALGPGTSYGPGPYTVQAAYTVERPPLGAGTQMETGVAFGLRDPDNFYLLQSSALHDMLALKRYIHGRPRWQQEVLWRTQGEESHTIAAAVQGDTVTAYADGRPMFTSTGLHHTHGATALWSRPSASTCFSAAQVSLAPLPAPRTQSASSATWAGFRG